MVIISIQYNGVKLKDITNRFWSVFSIRSYIFFIALYIIQSFFNIFALKSNIIKSQDKLFDWIHFSLQILSIFALNYLLALTERS